MEKTPRRSSLSPASTNAGSGASGSVVVDPTSQVPGPSSSRSGGGSAGVRRKAETTLVLQARRVDTLRRQVSERHRAQIAGRRRQVVLWALAGAGAVLLGGWLATRLSPPAGNELEAPLVLGRTEADGSVTAPQAPQHAAGQRSAGGARQERAAPATGQRSASSSNPGGAIRSGTSSAEAGEGRAGTEAESQAGSERSPDEPKTVGDWGDGFDSATSQGKTRRPAKSDAVNLDDLPTE